MAIRTLKTSELSSEQIERLYYLYHLTYSKINDKLLSKDDFIKKIKTYYEKVMLYEDENNTIQNCICTRQTNYGQRISLAFGVDKFSKERTKMLKDLLHNGHYAEASGAVAKILLNDNSIKVYMTPESIHYHSHIASHGKKIIFGEYKNGIEIIPEARKFFIFLYEYKKIKLQNNNIQQSLRELFNNVSKNQDIPEIYKLILLNKIARKLFITGYPNSIAIIKSSADKLVDILFNKEAVNSFLMIHQKLSSTQKEFINSILFTKVHSSLEKNMFFFQLTEANVNDEKNVFSAPKNSKL